MSFQNIFIPLNVVIHLKQQYGIVCSDLVLENIVTILVHRLSLATQLAQRDVPLK